MTFSLSTTVVSTEGDCLYTFEYAANVAQTSLPLAQPLPSQKPLLWRIAVIHVYVQLGVIEPTGSMLHSREIARIAQIQRLREDLGVNLVGAAIVLDLAQEVAQLRAQLDVYRWRSLSER
jgi:MerR HTH family regulatory protein